MRIVPFVKNGNEWNLTDQQILGVYLKMVEHRLVDKVFIMGEADTPNKFLSIMKNHHNAVNFVVNDDNECVSFSWLNRWGFNHAFCHHCFFPEAWGKHTVEIGKMTLKYWFSMKKDNGEPILDVIMGKTPENNRLGVRFAKKMGFTILGTVPDICLNIRTKKRGGAVFSYIKREEIENG